VIVIVALVVIKPERFPEIAYLLGSLIRRGRIWYQQILEKYNHFI